MPVYLTLKFLTEIKVDSSQCIWLWSFYGLLCCYACIFFSIQYLFILISIVSVVEVEILQTQSLCCCLIGVWISVLGLRCHLNDACSSDPCHSRAWCETSPIDGHYVCSCWPGWTGDDCAIELDECSQSKWTLFCNMAYSWMVRWGWTVFTGEAIDIVDEEQLMDFSTVFCFIYCFVFSK